MKNIIFILISFIAFNSQAHKLSICKGEYALCAASSTTPTGKTILVNGKIFKEGVAVCPVLTGDAIANLDLMNGSCDAPVGKVWSLFGVPMVKNYPQAPTWTSVPAVNRTFIIGNTETTGMSNMWSFPCKLQAQKANGVQLANCYGPIMESPFTNNHVKQGQTGFTQAPEGATYPVGGNK
jgi:hypothetical protein